MAFSLKGFLKKALNPLAPLQTMKRGIDQAKSGDWKGALKTSMIGGLTPGGITPDAPQAQPEAEAPPADLGPASPVSSVGSTEAAGVPSPFGGGMGRFGPRRMGGGSMGRFGGGIMGGGSRRLGGFGQQGGGFEPELQQIIQDFYKKRGGGGPAMGGGGGGFEQMGG